MKKLKLFFIFSFLFLFTACGSSKTDVIEIEFDSEVSSGYYWTYEIEDPSIVKVIEDFDDSSCDDDECVGIQRYSVVGLNSGVSTVVFKYFSEYDKNEYYAHYTFTVDNDLNIVESHMGTYFKR